MRKVRWVELAYAFFFQHLWLLTSVCLVATLAGVLWGCIANGHLPPEFPSPSDTGVFQPEGAYFTFGLFWAMIGLAATIGRHLLVFGTFLDDQRKLYRSAASSHQSSWNALYSSTIALPTTKKAGLWGSVSSMLLSERDDAKLLKMGTIIGIAGACFGTMVAAFDVRRHVVLHTIGAACLFIFTNLYYSVLLRINYLVMERYAVILEARHRDEHIGSSSSSSSSLTSNEASSPSLASSSAIILTTTSSAVSAPELSSSGESIATIASIDHKDGGSHFNKTTSHHGAVREFKTVVGSSGSVQNLSWLRVSTVMICWFCLFGIIGFRLQFVREGGHQSRDKERVAFLIFWANLFEWIWLGLVLVYGFIVFYWDYYHSPASSPFFGFSSSAADVPLTSGSGSFHPTRSPHPLVFRIRCEVQRPDDVHIV